jgi:hypothetical protein
MRTIKFLACAVFTLFACADPARAWDIKWIDEFGNGSVTATGGGGGTTDATGVYVGGEVFGALPGQSAMGGYDAFLRKYGFDGSVVWTRQFGTSGTEFQEGIATDATGVYVGGRTDGTLPGQTSAGFTDAFVRKYDTSGNIVWTLQFGTSHYDQPFATQGLAANGGAIYAGGLTFGTFPGETAGIGQDLFVAKIDGQSGALLWVRQFGIRGAFINIGGVTADDSGVYVAGNLVSDTSKSGTWTGLLRKYDFDGNLVWAKELDQGTTVCGAALWGLSAHDAHVYTIAQANIPFVDDPTSCGPNLSEVEGLLRKYDANGNLTWTRTIKAGAPNGRSGFTGAKVVHASDSGVFVGANATVQFAGQLPDLPRSDRSQCPGLLHGNQFADKLNAYVRRYDFDGNVIWTHQFGSNVFDLVTGIGTDAANVYLSGDTSCSIADGESFSGGNRDVFALAMAIDPTSLSGEVQLIVGQLETLNDNDRLNAGEFTSLVARLESALAALAQPDAAAASRALTGFVNDVQVLIGRGDLSSQEGNALIDAATAIIAQL